MATRAPTTGAPTSAVQDQLAGASTYAAWIGASLSIVGCVFMVCTSWWRLRRGDATFGLTAHLVTCLALSDLVYSVNLVVLQVRLYAPRPPRAPATQTMLRTLQRQCPHFPHRRALHSSIEQTLRHFAASGLPAATCTWWGILDNFFSTATICWTAMLAIDLIDFTSQARRTGELSLRATRARKMFYHTFVYLAATICTLPILIFAVAPQLPTIVKLSSIGGCFISDDQDGKIVGFILVTIPKAIGLFFNCGACVRRSFGALARVQLRFPSSPRSPPQRRGATECVARHQCARAHRCTPLALPPPPPRCAATSSPLHASARAASRRWWGGGTRRRRAASCWSTCSATPLPLCATRGSSGRTLPAPTRTQSSNSSRLFSCRSLVSLMRSSTD